MTKIKSHVALIILTGVFALSACKKTECHDCHYEDTSGAEVELGEKCDDELEQLEAGGIVVDGIQYEVHCHEH